MRVRLMLGLLASVFLLAGPALAADDLTVNGKIWTKGDQRVMFVWGTSYEMGFAHGYLLGPGIMDLMAVYAFPPEGTGPWLYEAARLFIRTVFDFSDQQLMDEAQGIYDGMIAGGVDPYVEVLNREFDVWDVLTFNGLADIKANFCATLAGWNTTTAMDADLNGEVAVAHNTDFLDEPEAPLLIAQNSLIISYDPDDPDQQRFFSVTSAGSLGSPAGGNESGIVQILNKGLALDNIEDRILDPKPQLVGWSARRALSARDVDGDGDYTLDDYFAFFDDTYQYSSTINQAIGPRATNDPPIAALEINNISRAMRYSSGDPNLAPDIMMILNWEDTLVPERNDLSQERYELGLSTIVDTYERQLTEANLWDFLVQLRASQDYFNTMNSMLFLPEQRRFALSVSDAEALAPMKEPVWYDIDELWPMVPRHLANDPSATLPDDDDDNDTSDDDDDNDDNDDNDTTGEPPAPDDDDNDDNNDDSGGCF